jgi:hypothetical protein
MYHGGVSAYAALVCVATGLGIGHSGETGGLGLARMTSGCAENSSLFRRTPAQYALALDFSSTFPVSFLGATKLTVLD